VLWRQWCASILSSGTSLNLFSDPCRRERVVLPRIDRFEVSAHGEGEAMTMHETLVNALAAGYEKIVAWADILDRINVYPVPDGDTAGTSS